MGGGWFGYVVSIFGCGAVLALLAGATLFLYGWNRVRGGAEPRVRVTNLSAGKDEP
ncbi:MAG: hypothetical protein KC619_19305 [Myxococcales bacterium]|nr:hypothetical protein [Myxococcales bacterium]